jgi:hypothetical protein
MKSCKLVYVSIGYVIKAVEDASQVPFLPLDIILFGQPISANKDGRVSSPIFPFEVDRSFDSESG